MSDVNAASAVNPMASHAPAGTLRLSHSASTLMQRCGKAYEYRHRYRLESQATSVNLGFGSAFDSAVMAYVVGQAFGREVDPKTVFLKEYNTFAGSHEVEYSTKWEGKDAVLEAGTMLAERFVDWWGGSGYTLMIDPNGAPIVQRKLSVMIGPNVQYSAILDMMVLTPSAEVALLDLKTPSVDCPEVFTQTSGQLTGQQLVVNAHRHSLGIEGVDKVGFLNAVKRPVPKTTRGEGPVVRDPHLALARSDEDVAEYVQGQLWVAEDIRKQRFAKRSMDAFNTPCGMCEYAQLCITGDRSKLQVRNSRANGAQFAQQVAAIP